MGEGRGIQGNRNSCYLDSTLFGLFALSDIFDEMFLEVTTNPNIQGVNRKAVSEMLWKGIVNPLRKYVILHLMYYNLMYYIGMVW